MLLFQFNSFGEISITLNYTNKIPNTGGTATPILAYTQVETVHHSDGSTSTRTHTSGGNVSYTLQEELEGASINATTGVVTYNVPNTTESEKTVGKVTVTVSMNDKTATKQVIVKQAATIPDNILRYGNIAISDNTQLSSILNGNTDMSTLLTDNVINGFTQVVNYPIGDNNPSTSPDLINITFPSANTNFYIAVFMLSNQNHNIKWHDEYTVTEVAIENIAGKFKESYPNTYMKNITYQYNGKQYKTMMIVKSAQANEYKIQIN